MADRRARVHTGAAHRINPIGEESREIHIAARKGNVQKLRRLLDSSVNPDTKTSDFSKTPLHYACQYGQLSAVKILLEYTADIEIKTVHERTPLHLAAAQGHSQVVDYLADSGADLNVKTPDMLSALDLTVKYKYPEAQRVLEARLRSAKAADLLAPMKDLSVQK